MDTLWDSINYYLRFYQRTGIHAWEHMTPMQYGSVLIGIAIFGWLLMRSGLKQ